MSIVCSSRVGSMFECGMATVAMLSRRSDVEADSASLNVTGAGSRDSLGRVGVQARDGQMHGRVRRSLPAGDKEIVAGQGWCVGRCLRTRGEGEEVELEAEADEAGQRSLEQQDGVKSPNNTDSNAPLA